LINQTQQEQQQTIVLTPVDYQRAIEQVLDELGLTPYVISIVDHIVSIEIDGEPEYEFYTDFTTGQMKTFVDYLREGSSSDPTIYFI
jgi:hypothetical protein